MKARLFAIFALLLALLALSSCSLTMTPTTTAPTAESPSTTTAITTAPPVSTVPPAETTTSTTVPPADDPHTFTLVCKVCEDQRSVEYPGDGSMNLEQILALFPSRCGCETYSYTPLDDSRSYHKYTYFYNDATVYASPTKFVELHLIDRTGYVFQLEKKVGETVSISQTWSFLAPFQFPTYYSLSEDGSDPFTEFTVTEDTYRYYLFAAGEYADADQLKITVICTCPLCESAGGTTVLTVPKTNLSFSQIFTALPHAGEDQNYTYHLDERYLSTLDLTWCAVGNLTVYARRAESEPKPDTVTLTMKSAVPFRPYCGKFLSADYATEHTVTLPYGSYTSEVEFVFEETKNPSASTYRVKSLSLDGAPLDRAAVLTGDAVLTATAVELYSYTVHFANEGFEMVEAELGADIATVLAETRKGDLGDLLASYSGGGYINLPIFYTDEARSESCRVTEFSADFTDIWLGKKTAPRLTLVCIEQCTLQHETELSIGYILPDMLAWHGVNNETYGEIEVVFYLDEDCTIPYVEEFPLTYYTEDVTLYGKPSREPSAAPTEATLYLNCPACGSIGLGKTYFGLTLREMIAAALSDCCSASASDYRWYTYDAFGMNYYFTDAELDSAPSAAQLSVFGEFVGTGGGAGGDTVTCDVSIVCSCASCSAAGGFTTVTVPYGSTLADLEARHEHGPMALIFTYYYDAGYTEEMSRSATIEADMTIYAYHPDLSDGTLLAIRCCDCGAETPAQRNDTAASALALLDRVCSCSAPRELYIYDPTVGEYVPIEPYMAVPTYCTELVNDPIYSISFVCDCGHAYTNTAQISKGVTTNELLWDYANCAHPSVSEPIRFFLDEARTEPFSYEGILHEHLTVYVSCAPEYPD